jgi:hypothetical protein
VKKYRGNHVGASLKLALAWDLKRGHGEEGEKHLDKWLPLWLQLCYHSFSLNKFRAG